LGDVLGLRHSLHRRPSEAKAFYAIFAGLLLVSAVIVIIPGSPLGLLTEGVQTLAGVLLPSATVFLLLLCNDRGVLGPWTNGRGMNIFSGVIIAVLVMLSTVLTASVLFPGITSVQIIAIFVVGTVLTVVAGAYLAWTALRHRNKAPTVPVDPARPAEPELDRATWRMPPIALLSKPVMSAGSRTGLAVLRGYLLVASALVVVKVVQLAMALDHLRYRVPTRKSTMTRVTEPQPAPTGQLPGVLLLSALLRRTAVDGAGHGLGRLSDIIVRL
ncbi:divalent metal cation transporter, partial [Agrobacterium sp. S2]|nr:divalent metal cation transporter [Agrobacterium sp. S2]